MEMAMHQKSDVFKGIRPEAVWEIFARICAVPHTSGNESALADIIAADAEKKGFTVRRDTAGNIRIDRRNADHRNALIMQAHLDMVPAAEAGKNFDFANCAVTPVVRGNRVVADGTTLGGDDGVGVAMALAAMNDVSLANANISVLLTVQEETGLVGANALAPDFLAGRGLINLDSGGQGVFQVGCAGGIRTVITVRADEKIPSPGRGVKVCISGLPGGHSGVDIDKGRPNAIILLSKVLEKTDFILSDCRGGSADNAIPAAAEFYGISLSTPEIMQDKCDEISAELKKNYPADHDFKIVVEPCETVSAALEKKLSRWLLCTLASAPDGVLEYDSAGKIVKTSSNIGQIFCRENEIVIVSSQRSFDDNCRQKAVVAVQKHFSCTGVECFSHKAYPAWTPVDSFLRESACSVWQMMYGTEPRCEVIHAGLECGVFAGKNPDLPMIAFFPDHGELHSPAEYVDIESVGIVYDFLLNLLKKTAWAADRQ